MAYRFSGLDYASFSGRISGGWMGHLVAERLNQAFCFEGIEYAGQ